MVSNKNYSFGRVFIIAGAFIAMLIGSGFETGQEILQYFVSYGYMGIVGAIVCLILLAFVGMSFVTVGHEEQFEQGNEIYQYYCGKYLGTFYDYFSAFFVFLSYTVMIGGAAATGAQQYGWSPFVGGSIMIVLSIVCVLFGLKKFVNIIGTIEPIVIVVSIFLGAYTLINNWDGFLMAEQNLAKVEVLQASNHWFLAALSYVGFCMLWLAAFMAQTGKEAASQKEGKLGAFWGAMAFCGAVILLTLALMSCITDIAGTEIPSLILANRISPIFGNLYSFMMYAGIFTTAVPLLWVPIARFSEEGTNKFKILTVVLGVIGGIIGLKLKFSQLVNIIYVLNGYVGILLLGIMIFHTIRYKGFLKTKK